MGYSTDFFGKIEVFPPLNKEEVSFLNLFNQTRRVIRNVDSDGRYYITNSEDQSGQVGKNILNMNQTPIGQPSLWCSLTASENGKAIIWDGCEKSYSVVSWMKYLITHFIGSHALMEQINPVLYAKHDFSTHILNGVMYAKGEEFGDAYRIIVEDNLVFVEELVPGQLGNYEIDPESENEDAVYDKQYDFWNDLSFDDLIKFKFGNKKQENYETDNIQEQELNNVQEAMRKNFIKQFKDSINVIEKVRKESKKKI